VHDKALKAIRDAKKIEFKLVAVLGKDGKPPSGWDAKRCISQVIKSMYNEERAAKVLSEKYEAEAAKQYKASSSSTCKAKSHKIQTVIL